MSDERRTFGTWLLAFLLLAGGLVLSQAGTTQAEGKRIWGYVSECGKPLVAPDTTVSLVNAFSGLTVATQDADAAGFYSFEDPAPGYYYVEFAAEGYFSAKSIVYRFDGSASIPVGTTCQDAFPAAPIWYNVTVIDAAFKTATDNLTARFTQTTVANEQIKVSLGNFNTATEVATLANARIVFPGPTSVMLKNASGDTPLVAGDYAVTYNPGSALTILNSNAKNALENFSARLEVSYRHSANTAMLTNDLIEAPTPSYWKNDVNTSGIATVDVDTGEVTVTDPTWVYGQDRLEVSYSYGEEIPGSSVVAWNTTRDEAVRTLTTDTKGVAKASLWAGDFTIAISKDGMETRDFVYTPSADTVERQYLSSAETLLVRLANNDGDPVTAGVVGILYQASAPEATRFLPGSVDAGSNTVRFRPRVGASYILMVDADGYDANIQNYAFAGDDVQNLVLDRSEQERVDTTITYAPADWNTLTIARNLRLNNDSMVPGLDHSELRNANLQIDLAVGGNGNGVLNGTEQADFQAWVQSVGPRWVTTEGLLTTNGIAYVADNGGFTSGVTWDASFINITTSQTYTRQGSTAIPLGNARYFSNLTAQIDTNTTAYTNYTYVVDSVDGYERTSRHTSAVTGFTTVTIDPPASGVSQFNLLFDQSKLGKARARVTGPAQNYTETNVTDTGYAATVNASTPIVFSANGTTVGVGDPADATYSWRWNDGSGLVGTGIWTTKTFAANPTPFIVNLSVEQPNVANTTYFNLRITVDSVDPVAQFTSDTPGPVNESVVITFRGGASTDARHGVTPGQVSEWHWDFNGDGVEDGQGQNVTKAFEDPGTFNVTLWVVDWVGHRSPSRRIPQVVEDNTPPEILFWTIAKVSPFEISTEVREGVAYSFDAAPVSDNCKDDTMTYAWKFERPDGTNDTYAVMNVTSHSWAAPGTYTVNLTVTDCANNVAYRQIEQVVTVNSVQHANIKVESLVADPTSVEEGNTVTVTVTYKHIAGGVPTAVTVRVQLQDGANLVNLTPSISFLDSAGAASADGDVGPNITKKARFTYNVGDNIQRRVLKVTVEGVEEPKPWVDSANSQTVTITVKAAWWKQYQLLFIFLAFIIIIPIVIYAYPRIADRMAERRQQRAEADDEEEEEKKDEEDEDEAPKKKRL